jgi:predicted Zn-dependent peptidase
VGGNWLQRREYRTVADDLKSLGDVTVEEIARVMKKYPLTAASTIAVGPREKVREPK